jgi:hypothetical protein
MARKFIYPDVDDRTVNEPMVIVSPAQVRGLCNQSGGAKLTGYGPDTEDEFRKDWFVTEMKARGWDSAEFFGNQCLLRANLKVHIKARIQPTK